MLLITTSCDLYVNNEKNNRLFTIRANNKIYQTEHYIITEGACVKFEEKDFGTIQKYVVCGNFTITE